MQLAIRAAARDQQQLTRRAAWMRDDELTLVLLLHVSDRCVANDESLRAEAVQCAGQFGFERVGHGVPAIPEETAVTPEELIESLEFRRIDGDAHRTVGIC